MASRGTLGRLVVAGFLTSAVLVSAVPSLADPMRLRVQNVSTGSGVVITDNGAGDLDPVPGSILATPVLGAQFALTLGVGTSMPPLPGAGSLLTLTGVVVATTPGTLRFLLENDDYAGGATVAGFVSGNLIGPAGTSISLQSWLNVDNLVPAFGPDVSSPGALPAVTIPAGSLALFSPAVFGPGVISGTATEAFSAAGPYSLFAEAIVTFTGFGTASFTDTQVVATPEPGTMVLLGAGLIALAVLPVLRRAARAGRPR